MSNRNGFSLLELLFVLVIVSILILVSVPFYFKSLEKQQEKQFIETLEFDMLYIQSMAMHIRKEDVAKQMENIFFGENDYRIHLRETGEMIIRKYPKNFKVDVRVRSKISFNEKGTIRHPGNIQIKTKHSVYSVIFPLGKGRFRIVET